MTLPRAIKFIDRLLDLKGAQTVLDYGCGDQSFKPHFERLGYSYTGWDLDHEQGPQEADLVNLNYVLNVIPTVTERCNVLQQAWTYSRRAMVIAIPPGFILSHEGNWCRKSSDELLEERREIENITKHNVAWLKTHLDADITQLAPDIFLCLNDLDSEDQASFTHLFSNQILRSWPRRKALSIMGALAGGLLTGSTSAILAQENTTQRLFAVISEQLGVREETIHESNLFVDDLGADSLDTVELIMALEDEFQIEIPDDAASQMLRVVDAYRYIKQELAR